MAQPQTPEQFLLYFTRLAFSKELEDYARLQRAWIFSVSDEPTKMDFQTQTDVLPLHLEMNILPEE